MGMTSEEAVKAEDSGHVAPRGPRRKNRRPSGDGAADLPAVFNEDPKIEQTGGSVGSNGNVTTPKRNSVKSDVAPRSPVLAAKRGVVVPNREGAGDESLMRVHLGGDFQDLPNIKDLVEVGGFFARNVGSKGIGIEKFPGGLDLLDKITTHLLDPSGGLLIEKDTLDDFLQAGRWLECPRLYNDIASSAYVANLSHRGILVVLEELIKYTTSTFQTRESDIQNVPREGNKVESAEQFAITVKFETEIWQAQQEVIHQLANMITVNEFVLSERLATGSLQASLLILQIHREKNNQSNFAERAFQGMVGGLTGLFRQSEEHPNRKDDGVHWSEHDFAFCVFKLHILACCNDCDEVTYKYKSGDDFDEYLEDIADFVKDPWLEPFADLVEFLDQNKLNANAALAPLLLKSLILADKQEDAQVLFCSSFGTSRKVRDLVIREVIPIKFLFEVKEDPQSSKVFREYLRKHFQNLKPAELTFLIDEGIVNTFAPMQHGVDDILANDMTSQLIIHCCRVKKTNEPEDQQHRRLRRAGERLFAASFVAQKGFLPAGDEPFLWDHTPVGPTACSWDDKRLDIWLLHRIFESEVNWHTARRVPLIIFPRTKF